MRLSQYQSNYLDDVFEHMDKQKSQIDWNALFGISVFVVVFFGLIVFTFSGRDMATVQVVGEHINQQALIQELPERIK